MCQPHKHAAVIKAWADGATIECRTPDRRSWQVINTSPTGAGPCFYNDYEYRVKSKPLTLDEVYVAALEKANVPCGAAMYLAAWRDDFMEQLVQLLKENNHV